MTRIFFSSFFSSSSPLLLLFFSSSPAIILMQRCCSNIHLKNALLDGLDVVKAYNGLHRLNAVSYHIQAHAIEACRLSQENHGSVAEIERSQNHVEILLNVLTQVANGTLFSSPSSVTVTSSAASTMVKKKKICLFLFVFSFAFCFDYSATHKKDQILFRFFFFFRTLFVTCSLSSVSSSIYSLTERVASCSQRKSLYGLSRS